MSPVRHIVFIGLLGLVQACGGGGGGSNQAATQPPPAPPAPVPPQTPTVETRQVFENLDFQTLVALVQAPGDDSRWFAVEQTGVVRVFDNDLDVTTSDVFVDISPVVVSGGERGLLGMAFHPDFATNGEAFLSFNSTGAGNLTSRVSRFRSLDNGLTLDPGSEENLLLLFQEFNNHNGGNIAFGPDGFLYIGFGDGGSGNDPNNRAQDTRNLFGAMLRIDVNGAAPYGIPADNPFAGNPICTQGFGGADCPEIFAYGLRNPWRWSFDRQTGELWLGDVGQGQWEEVDNIRRGENYGWRLREGAHCNTATPDTCDRTGLTDPFWEYDHGQGRSITGGYVYRGNEIASLDGHYIFGDFGSGRVWGIPVDGSSGATELLSTSWSISSFAEDNAGELYIVHYAGEVHKIVAGP